MGPGIGSPLSLLTFRETRRFLRRSGGVMMAVTFVLLYALGSMVLGGMIILANLGGGYQVIPVWGNGLGTSFWSYPGLLIIAPWGYVELPFFATLSMVVVSVGVGIGMSVAVLLGIALVRSRRAAAGRPAAVGTIAGLTPAMIALVTLGACCSVTAAATAGVGIVAQVSGSTTDNLLLNNWFLGVFQMVVVWIALLAQELVLRVYGGLLGITGSASAPTYEPPRLDRRVALGTLVRSALLIGGITWSLAMLVEWTSVGPLAAPPGVWVRWILEHQLPAMLAILAGLFPSGTYQALKGLGSRAGWAVRAVLAVSGALLIFGAPPPFPAWGVEGFANEVLGALGLPASWGGVTPVFAPGVDLYFRWGLQYLLLGGFALLAGLAPSRAFRPLQWTVGAEHVLVRGAPAAVASAPAADPAPAAGAMADGR